MTELGLSVQEHGLDKTEVFAEVERMLGAAVRDFASELRLADAADFAAFIRIGHMPNLLKSGAIVRRALFQAGYDRACRTRRA